MQGFRFLVVKLTYLLLWKLLIWVWTSKQTRVWGSWSITFPSLDRLWGAAHCPTGENTSSILSVLLFSVARCVCVGGGFSWIFCPEFELETRFYLLYNLLLFQETLVLSVVFLPLGWPLLCEYLSEMSTLVPKFQWVHSHGMDMKAVFSQLGGELGWAPHCAEQTQHSLSLSEGEAPGPCSLTQVTSLFPCPRPLLKCTLHVSWGSHAEGRAVTSQLKEHGWLPTNSRGAFWSSWSWVAFFSPSLSPPPQCCCQ